MIPKMVDDSLVGLRSGGSEEDRLQALQWIETQYEMMSSPFLFCHIP